MAQVQATITLDSNNSSGIPSGANHAGKASGAHNTSVEAAVATLEADGASPTQAHVTALRTQWNLLKSDLSGHVIVSWDSATVTTLRQLKAALDQAYFSAKSGLGGLTP